MFDRYPVPATLTADEWRAARSELARRLESHRAASAQAGHGHPEPFAGNYFDLMPIHKKLTASDAPAIRNYLQGNDVQHP